MSTVPEPAELRQFLAERLPDYMVPPAYVALPNIPRNTNGKLDRAALPVPDVVTVAGRTPRDDREQKLCVLFAGLLGLKETSIDDDFFSLGGHSLLVAKLITLVREEFGVDIGIRTVFEAPTVAKLAPRLGEEPGAGDEVLPLRVKGSLPPLFCVAPAAGLALSYTGLLPSVPDRPVYGLQLLGEHESVADVAEDLVRRIREIQPAGPYHLLGTSFGGLVAHEMATQLQEAGEPVALVALLDSYPFPRAWRDLPALSEEDFAAGVVSDLSPGQVALAYKAYTHHSHLGFAWTPRLFTGDVLHFRATEDKTPDWPGPETWKSHVDGQVVMYEITCTHNEMTSAAPLAEIGAVIAAHTEFRRVS